MSGYDIRRNLRISLDSLWTASYGQIYPALHKLKEDGLITARSAPVGQRDRIVYELTDAGRQEFHDWLHQPVEYLPARDPFRFWASYLDMLPERTVVDGIERHIATQRERRAYFLQVISSIESGEHPLIKARSETLDVPMLERLKATRSMIFQELVAQADFEIASAERIRRFHAGGLRQQE